MPDAVRLSESSTTAKVDANGDVTLVFPQVRAYFEKVNYA